MRNQESSGNQELTATATVCAVSSAPSAVDACAAAAATTTTTTTVASTTSAQPVAIHPSCSSVSACSSGFGSGSTPAVAAWGNKRKRRSDSSSEDVRGAVAAGADRFQQQQQQLLPGGYSQPTAAKQGRQLLHMSSISSNGSSGHGSNGSSNSSSSRQHQQQTLSSIAKASSTAALAAMAAEAATRKQPATVYIRLAAESPPGSDEDSSVDSEYGSCHAVETDVCRDTSDTDYSTEEFATLDILEYEVPSDSSTNEDLYSHDSSSGTDQDFVVTAAQLARVIFNSQQRSSDDDGADTNDDRRRRCRHPSAPNTDSDGSASAIAMGIAAAAAAAAAADQSSEFELFADTEGDSDAPTDPELGRADYWKCVKCKNRQNNPMYRYCERCYQIRKSHFPPRPKLAGQRRTLARAAGAEQRPRSAARRERRRNAAAPAASAGPGRAEHSAYDGTTDDYDEEEEEEEEEADAVLDEALRDRRRRRGGRRPRPLSALSTGAASANAAAQAAAAAEELANPPNNTRTANGSRTPQSPHSVASDVDMFAGTGCDTAATNTQRSTFTLTGGVASQAHLSASGVVVAAPSQAPPTHLPLLTYAAHSASLARGRGSATRDSGFASGSATDLTPDTEPTLTAMTAMASRAALLAASSQETFCSDVDETESQPSQRTPTAAAAGAGSSGTALSATSTLSNLSGAAQPVGDRLPDTRSASSCSSAAAVETQEEELDLELDDADEQDVTLRGSLGPCESLALNSAAVTASTSTSSAAAVVGAAAAELRQQLTAATQAAEADAGPNGLCMMCLSQPKNGVFVHSRFLHLCCCYRCAVKVWNKQKRCPICNCKVKNVMKLFVH